MNDQTIRSIISDQVSKAKHSMFEALVASISFAGRDEYLAWRREWKAVYAEASESVRTSKRQRADQELSDDQRSSAQAAREIGRTQARALLAVRAAGKEVSARARNKLQAA